MEIKIVVQLKKSDKFTLLELEFCVLLDENRIDGEQLTGRCIIQRPHSQLQGIV